MSLIPKIASYRPTAIRSMAACLSVFGFFGTPHRVPADSVKPLPFGPYVLNSLSGRVSPTAWDRSLTHFGYSSQLGWVEPIWGDPHSLFHHTYFETIVGVELTPYQADFGTTFNFKPVRYLEVGLTYNRLLFLGSMTTFSRFDGSPPREEWTPRSILSRTGEWGGADIFTFHAGLTVDLPRLQLHMLGTRALWDVNARGKSHVYEYGTDLLIRTDDRVNELRLAARLSLRPWTDVGIMAVDHYWIADGTGIEKNLIATGLTGLRLGKDGRNQRRGLDLLVGFWTRHPQLTPEEPWEDLVVLLHWSWDVRFLEI